MFMICGYDFCEDINSLNPAPVLSDNYSKTRLAHGVFDHWNVTRDVTSSQSIDIPTAWDYFTIMNANFDGNIEAGNLNAVLSEINGFKIKRRKVGEFAWVTLTYLPIEEIEGVTFVFEDNLAASGIEYEYSFVPVVSNIEGNYISNTIGTKFDGVFICDLDTIYRFYAGVNYGTEAKVQKVGVFEPYGRKYPIVVANGVVSYSAGSFTGTILPNNYGKDKTLNIPEMIKKRKELLEFLTNKRAKLLKDWNGNCWLMIIAGSPQVSYEENTGMALANVGASWIELGDADSQADLYASGVVKEVG